MQIVTCAIYGMLAYVQPIVGESRVTTQTSETGSFWGKENLANVTFNMGDCVYKWSELELN